MGHSIFTLIAEWQIGFVPTLLILLLDQTVNSFSIGKLTQNKSRLLYRLRQIQTKILLAIRIRRPVVRIRSPLGHEPSRRPSCWHGDTKEHNLMLLLTINVQQITGKWGSFAWSCGNCQVGKISHFLYMPLGCSTIFRAHAVYHSSSQNSEGHLSHAWFRGWVSFCPRS